MDEVGAAAFGGLMNWYTVRFSGNFTWHGKGALQFAADVPTAAALIRMLMKEYGREVWVWVWEENRWKLLTPSLFLDH